MERIAELVAFWRSQKIEISTKTIEEIGLVERKLDLKLPNDFKAFYTRVNGMENFYPNEIDEEGFLFYPVDAIVSANKELRDCNLVNKDKIFIFAEYMHKSWWYGFELKEENKYVIGIIPDNLSFKPITSTLEEFIELYLGNSPKLYDYLWLLLRGTYWFNEGTSQSVARPVALRLAPVGVI